MLKCGSDSADIVIIGSGMGGATMAWALAETGARIVILEKGHQLQDSPENRDPRAIFQRGHFRPKENWYGPDGVAFNPGNYYYQRRQHQILRCRTAALSRRRFRWTGACGRTNCQSAPNITFHA